MLIFHQQDGFTAAPKIVGALRIADPIGGPLQGYVQCRDQIEAGVQSALKFLETHPSEAEQPRKLMFAVGSDHAGFALKQVLVAELKKRLVEVVDAQPKSFLISLYFVFW